MSETTYASFAIVGAGPHIGLPIVHALVARGAPILVLARPSSTKKTLPPGAQLVPVEYDNVSAVASILREHKVDVLVSAMSFVRGDGFLAQKPLIDAAKEAGVKLFVPSEFGMPPDGLSKEINPILTAKARTVEYLKSLGLPYALLYNGLFHEFVPFVAAIPETGKFFILGKGDKPVSFTAIEDVAGFLAHILTTLPPSQLHNAIFRLEGQRATMTEIAALHGDEMIVEYVDKLPSDLPGPTAHVKEDLQKVFELGAGSSGWDTVTRKDSEQANGANALWEGHQWKTIKQVLNL